MSVDKRGKMLRKKVYTMVATCQYHTAKTCKKMRICKICTIMHPTGLHRYVPRWKGGGAADNGKDGHRDTLKTNFAEMDIKSVSANIVSKIISM